MAIYECTECGYDGFSTEQDLEECPVCGADLRKVCSRNGCDEEAMDEHPVCEEHHRISKKLDREEKKEALSDFGREQLEEVIIQVEEERQELTDYACLSADNLRKFVEDNVGGENQ